MNINEILKNQFNLRDEQINNTIKLIDEGNTIPFIARYRKEMHGTCDDQVLREFAFGPREYFPLTSGPWEGPDGLEVG